MNLSVVRTILLNAALTLLNCVPVKELNHLHSQKYLRHLVLINASLLSLVRVVNQIKDFPFTQREYKSKDNLSHVTTKAKVFILRACLWAYCSQACRGAPKFLAENRI